MVDTKNSIFLKLPVKNKDLLNREDFSKYLDSKLTCKLTEEQKEVVLSISDILCNSNNVINYPSIRLSLLRLDNTFAVKNKDFLEKALLMDEEEVKEITEKVGLFNAPREITKIVTKTIERKEIVIENNIEKEILIEEKVKIEETDTVTQTTVYNMVDVINLIPHKMYAFVKLIISKDETLLFRELSQEEIDEYVEAISSNLDSFFKRVKNNKIIDGVLNCLKENIESEFLKQKRLFELKITKENRKLGFYRQQDIDTLGRRVMVRK